MAVYIYNIPLCNNGFIFLFNTLTGWLLSKPYPQHHSHGKPALPIPVTQSLYGVHAPYTLLPMINVPSVQIYPSLFCTAYARIIVFACRHSFFFARMISSIPFVRFPNTVTSIAAFRSVYPGSAHQRTLCLPRTLFALATSRSFKQNGVAFIGVFLPSRKMHAWIIEGNRNPDPKDDIWICYQPVAAITK